MLVSWTINNFKSVGQEITLPLAPLTILVGANSAGKSTIIQSILLIKQTIQYAATDKPIALNGPLLKLGNYNDVRNAITKNDTFRIAWEYDLNHFFSLFPTLSEYAIRRQTAYSPYRRLIKTICCSGTFGVSQADQSELALLAPMLKRCDLSVQLVNQDQDQKQEYTYTIVAEEPFTINPLLLSGRPSPLFKCKLDPETEAKILEDHPKGVILGAILRHIFPAAVMVKYDVRFRRAAQIAEIICSPRYSPRHEREYNNFVLPDAVYLLLRDWWTANSEYFSERGLPNFPLPSGASVGDLLSVFNKVRQRGRYIRTEVSFPSLQEHLPDIVSYLEQSIPSELDVEIERPRAISDANFMLRDYFEDNVLYLGPLRDEPKPVYPLEALARPTDVGYRGELTAAVLHLNQSKQVFYIPSKCFTSKTAGVEISFVEVSTHEAVVDWLSYMGVAEDIFTGDKGKLGHELQVKSQGVAKKHDLTNVGVGVSQVLPIVVMAILASPGSLLIFEQPELHLHPRVQTRLADFFISVALSGKQCIVETHSEYLIHRLRRRIAEATDDELTRLSRLYFVEREGGITSCRAVDVTKYGAILEWPADFFDQAQVEAEKILAAATAKRASERKAAKETYNETKPRS